MLMLKGEKAKVLLVPESTAADAKTMFVVLVSKHETRRGFHPKSGGPTSAELELRVSVLDANDRYAQPRRFDWGASYEGLSEETVRLSNGAIILDHHALKGMGVGKYLFNEVVSWAKQWPEAKVKSILLYDRDGEGENKERRNAFYERFGLVFDYRDDRASGHSLPMKAGDLRNFSLEELNEGKRSGPIVVREVDDFFADTLKSKAKLSDDNRSLQKGLDHWRERQKECDKHPVQFAAKMLWIKWRDWIILILFAVVIGLIYQFG